MIILLVSFFVAALATLIAVRGSAQHLSILGDTERSQPQKFHSRVVPRIGGFGIALGVIAGLALAMPHISSGRMTQLLVLAGASLLVLGVGLLEDVTKRITPRQRMLVTLLAAALTLWLAEIGIERTDLAGIDPALQIVGVSFLLTLFAVSGVVNSINIIDGFNGLASMCVAIMLAALAYVAHEVGDTLVFSCALATLGAVLGFFVWNYPLGLIFLGDGGAYFLGFWVAELGILLVQRNLTVSPIFPLLLCAYPIFETVFTMYRRKIVRGRPMGLPDATHLHSLIYRRIMRWAIGRQDAAALLKRNSMTSPYLWVMCSLTAIPAVLWWDNSTVLQLCLGGFCVFYVLVYRAIVRFRTPKLLLRNELPWSLSKSAG
ncbi:MAG: glycosyltransferase family 4 protein [Burkholderiales bacterium]|nr:glycosyltransferase family 4 protein [Burkholderiales bacterium]